VGVARGRDAGADVEKLPDARFVGKVANGTAEERAVGAHRDDDVRIRLNHLLAGFPVGSEVVLAAKQVVIHARGMRHAGVEAAGQAPIVLGNQAL
jgi:hypothetical protein